MNETIAPFVHKTLHERLADRLEEAIIHGELPPGAPLPSERELALQFRVSRSAVRDATRMLAATGLVQVRPGVGTIVTANGEEAYQNSLTRFLRRSKYSPIELLDLRRHIEVQLCARLAQDPTPEAVSRLQTRLEALHKAVDTGDRGLAEERHVEFHLALAEGVGNRALIDLLGPLIRVSFDITLSEERLATPPAWSEYDDHCELVQCIATGDVDGARRFTNTHLDQAIAGLGLTSSAGSPKST